MSAPLKVIYEDNHLLVCIKPAGVLSQSDETGDGDLLTTAKGWVKNKYNKPGNVFMGLVHRIDRPASGVLVLARTSKAAARLARSFQSRKAHKRYFALVQGDIDLEPILQDYIRKSDRQIEIVSERTQGAKFARLRWRKLGFERGVSLLDIELETGRPHQIRLQFSSRGFHILGDYRYGGTQLFDKRNIALHAYALELDHPTKGELMRWTAPPPASWNGWCDQQWLHQVESIQLLEGALEFV